MVSERPKMNHSNTHRKPILLYCSQATQTRDDSELEAEDSDFPPCCVGNCPPLISHYSPVTVPSHSRYPPAAASGTRQLTISSEEEPSQSQHRQHTGLGQTNIVNIVDATATVSHTKVILYISCM
jgi:hypothetical protein